MANAVDAGVGGGGVVKKLVDAKKTATVAKTPLSMNELTYLTNTLNNGTSGNKSWAKARLAEAGVNAAGVQPNVALPNLNTVPNINKVAPVTPTKEFTVAKPVGVTDVKINQGNTGVVGNNPIKPTTVAPVTAAAPTTTTTKVTDTKTTLYDYAKNGGYDLKWSDGNVLLNGIELPRETLESAGGRLVNGRWTFDSPANIDGLIGKAVAPAETPDNGVLAGIDAIQTQFEDKIKGIEDQLGAMTIDQYVEKAWQTLKPMYDFQSNELTGTSQFNRLANEAGQEARGLGTSGLYGAENKMEDKTLMGALNELFATTNVQALQTGESLYNSDRNRLMDMFNLTKESYASAMDVLNVKLEDYYNSANLDLNKKGQLFDIFDSNRTYNQDQTQWNAEFTENQKMNQHNIDMDNWSKAFQERNANRAAAAANIANKKSPWGTDDYDDEMFITRSAMIEMLFDQTATSAELEAAWKQATLEFPELAQDAALVGMLTDSRQTRPVDPTLPALPTDPFKPNAPNYADPNERKFPMINK